MNHADKPQTPLQTRWIVLWIVLNVLLFLPGAVHGRAATSYVDPYRTTTSFLSDHLSSVAGKQASFTLAQPATSTASVPPAATATSQPPPPAQPTDTSAAATPTSPDSGSTVPTSLTPATGSPAPLDTTPSPGPTATQTNKPTSQQTNKPTNQQTSQPTNQPATPTPATSTASTGGPSGGGSSLWRNSTLYVLLGVIGVIVLALIVSARLREMLIHWIRTTPPAELVLWGSIAFIVILLATTGSFLFRNPGPIPDEEAGPAATGLLAPSATPPLASPLPGEAASTTSAQVLPSTATPRPTLPSLDLPKLTPPQGGQVITVTPSPEDVGWVRQDDETPNHFGDYNIYAGIFDGQIHLGAVQFDLSAIPPGASIAYADLTLVGLSQQWLGDSGTWHVELLEPWMGDDWTQQSYTSLQRPDGAALELSPALPAGDLSEGRANTWVLDAQALTALEARTYAGRVSFRIRGPDAGIDNLFTWDSGYGTGSRARGPILRLAIGSAPATPPPSPTPRYVIVTSVPPTLTPENVVTLAAQLMTATAEATPYQGTGTPTPTPTATSLPPDWVTPVIVAPTETPANVATAQWHALVMTAEAFVYGTPTPLPPNVWTVTPTPAAPLLLDLSILTPTSTTTPTPQVTPTPAGVPSALRGRIAFQSDRVPSSDWILAMTPDGGDVRLLANRWAYDFVRDRQTLSPDATQRVGVETTDGVPHVVRLSLTDGDRQTLTGDRLSYDPVWSPAGDWIAYVRQAPDGNEEIYLMRPDGTEQTRLTFTPEAYEKQPTWSPDGTRIAFVSNRETGHAQIWVMNADGTGFRNLSHNEYNEHDPVWLK